MTRPVMIVDGLNLFTRAFAANPTIATTGQPMGGVVGFMGMLRKMVEEQRPRSVYVVWEGGGSTRRRQLFPEYKAHRRPVKLNRFYGDDIPNTVANRDDQVAALVRCLKHTPVCQLYVADCEADDVIAYLCRTQFAAEDVTIVSSDRDFYQLLDDTTRIFRPGKKVFVTKPDMLREFAISPRNFPLAKALCGDDSDNIPGVRGVGFKVVASRFPSMSSDEEYGIDALFDDARAAAATTKVKAFSRIVESEALVRRNMRLVDLDGSMLNPEQRRQVDHLVEAYTPGRNKIALIRELLSLGLPEFNADDFHHTMSVVGA